MQIGINEKDEGSFITFLQKFYWTLLLLKIKFGLLTSNYLSKIEIFLWTELSEWKLLHVSGKIQWWGCPEKRITRLFMFNDKQQ